MMTTEAPVYASSFSEPPSPAGSPQRPALVSRRSSSLHKIAISKFRPLPFQYVWAVWHDKSGSSWSASSSTNSSASTPSSPASAYDDRLTLLADAIPDIATFYRVWNNFPWDAVKQKDSVHVFRQGVKPLWEDEENLDGGGWVLKIKRDEGKAIKTWEEVCLIVCGGELQSSLSGEHDHVLGMSYSPRLYWAHITIWNKQGNNTKSIQMLQEIVLERLSENLRPASDRDYYYKKHSDHDGWGEAVRDGKPSETAKRQA